MGIPGNVYSRMVVVLSLLWMSQFYTVSATIGRYGGFRRPVASQPVSYGRPNQPFPGQMVASPTHAYSILAKPSNVFRPQSQFQAQPQPFRYQNPPFQQQQLQQHHHQQQVQAPVRFPHQPQQQLYYQTPVQYFQPSVTSNQLHQTSGYYSYQTPTAFTIQSRPSNIQYHVHASPSAASSKPVSFDSLTSGSNQVMSYEGCTSNHWQPIQGGLSSSASTQSVATAPSSPTSYFYGASVSPSTSFGSANTRAVQSQQTQASNKVVVLSHETLKTLLANPNKIQSESSKPAMASDSVGSASVNSHVIVASNTGNAGGITTNVVDQPSVKLVGYIGPASDNTPSGYIQIPINKNVMDGLGGPQTSYDFALNSTNYSLFTLKSVSDVQTILGSVKANDNKVSESQTIPLGLVVKNEAKAFNPSDALFYSSAASSPVASVTTTTGQEVNPSIQMVGHVQITSPDVSSHFVKRKDDGFKETTS